MWTTAYKYSTYCTYLYQYKSLGEQYIQDDSIRTTCSVAPQERRSYDMLKNVPDLKSIIESHTQGIRYRLFFCKTIIFSKYSIYIREAACCCCSYHWVPVHRVKVPDKLVWWNIEDPCIHVRESIVLYLLYVLYSRYEWTTSWLFYCMCILGTHSVEYRYSFSS